jgi:FtsH-binding integral membrane protein
LRLLGGVFARPLQAFFQKSSSPEQAGTRTPVWQRYRSLFSVLVGLLLAFPLVSLLAVLLAEADPVFDRNMTDLLKILRIENIGEYILRLTYISIGAYLLAGVLLFALLSSREENLSDKGKPAFAPFLGWVEASTVLASVDLLFAFFVTLQFRYFFGGQANIRAEGFTYAEYARRGFGELVAVALISLLIFLGLSAITRRDKVTPRRFFSGLGIGLLGLVAVILVSAFQRLQLYELAYGFSRIRTYTHVFMVWLGVLLAVTVLLEAAGRMRHFALALVLTALGFGATINLVNVDGFIARANLQRAAYNLPLDTAYLASLTDDAAPVLFGSLQNEHIPAAVRRQVGALLACQAARRDDNADQRPWQAAHWSEIQAAGLFQQYQVELSAYRVRQRGFEWLVTIDGIEQPCASPAAFFD